MADITTFAALNTACQTSGTYTVGANITFTATIAIPVGVNINLSSHGGPFTLTQATSGLRHFQVLGSLTLGNIVIDGGQPIPSFDSDGNPTAHATQVSGGIVLNYNSSGTPSTLPAINPSLILNDGAIVQHCYSATGGGVLANVGDVTLNNGSQVVYNSTSANGGGLACYGVSTSVISTITINGGLVAYNYGGNSAGGIDGDNQFTTVNLNSGAIRNNSTLKAGGGLEIYGMFNMTGGSISQNKAGINGGGVSNLSTNAQINISGGSISNNTAVQLGGGFFLRFGGTFTVSGILPANGGIVGQNYPVIQNNSAGTNGGGMSFTDTPMTSISIANCQISENTATALGGGIYLDGNNSANLASVNLSSNTAQNGGGWYANQATLTVDKGIPAGQNSTIGSNTATQNGGGGYLANVGTLFDKGANYTSNTAGSGGGIYVAGGKGHLYGSTITQNITSANGGGIYVDTSSFVFSKGLTLTHNKSRLGKGGGAYVLGQFITAEVEIHYNSAAVCGGGVCVE
ncbi:MAG: hypothetical protein FWF59_09945 [Turicibacter sp.]|nr:hypothetical protein [Turicibacter sp.]